VDIVIIGSGIAGISLAEELRKQDPAQRITVVTHETHGYYSRPLLSHGFSREDIEQKIVLRSFNALREMGIEVLEGVEVRSIDRNGHSIALSDDGTEQRLDFGRLVLAVGSDALIPPPFRPYRELFQVLNSLDDLLALRRLRAGVLSHGRRPHWAVVGGGLIGCELSSDLARSGDRVTLYHALPRLMERQLVEEDSQTLAGLLADSSVELRLDSAVAGFAKGDRGYAVELGQGLEGTFDGIIVACGFKPRVELARAADLPVNRGIRVDHHLSTADPDIFAVGDVAECPDGRIYAYILPIRSQALWLSKWITGRADQPWDPPFFKPKAKVHGFTAAHPYLF
jgi:NAD(P)H-nitrite reductase large subunit